MAGIELSDALNNAIGQSPYAAAGIYIARFFIRRHEEAVQKLVSTFEAEVKACEERYNVVFDELMKIKDKLSGL